MNGIGVIIPNERVEDALRAGVDYVEPTIVGNLVQRDESGSWVKNPDYSGPEDCPSFAILFPGELQLADPGFPAEEVTRYLEAAMPIIASVARPGAKIVFGSGRARTVPNGVDRGAAEERFAEVVREARDVAARNDLVIVLEPLNTGETNLLNSIAECVDFLDSHEIDGVPIVADLYHIMLEREPLTALTEHGSRIGHAHIADSGRRAPGLGDWPLQEFLQGLRSGGYTGSVSLECVWEDFAAELRPAVEHVRGLV